MLMNKLVITDINPKKEKVKPEKKEKEDLIVEEKMKSQTVLTSKSQK